MRVGDKFKVKDGCQWPGQAGWTGQIHRVDNNNGCGYSIMRNGKNFKFNDPDREPDGGEYFYYESDIEIIDSWQYLPDPEFSLEEINQAQDQMG